MVNIRRAEGRDAAAISHVHVQSWRTTYAGMVPEDFLASLNEAERIPRWQQWLAHDISVFVAADVQGELVGFAGGGAIREPFPAYDAELYTIYLLKESQGHGIGKHLFNAVVRDLSQKNYQSLLVWVLEQNSAIHFYAKCGAQRLSSKQIEIGGAQLPEVALGWPDLQHALSATTTSID